MYKISRLSIYAALTVAVLLEATILRHIGIFGNIPDIGLACVVFFGLFLGPGAGLEAGLFAGLLNDFSSLDIFGINAFIFALAGFLAGAMNTKVFRESSLTQVSVVFFFISFSMALHYWMVSVLFKGMLLNFSEYLASSIMPCAVYTSLFAPLIFSRLCSAYSLRDSEEYL